MSYGSINIDTITGSGASSVIVNNGTNNVAGFTTGNNIQMLQNGGGIVFSNSSALTNSTLNDYETGTWTPTDASGAGLTFTVNSATYTKVGRLVYIQTYLLYPSTANTSAASIGGLPFTSAISTNIYHYINGRNGYTVGITWQVTYNSTSMLGQPLYGTTNPLNANLSGQFVIISGCYEANF